MGPQGGWNLFQALGGALLALGCSTEAIHFVPDSVPDHCADERTNPERGESDVDCGGPDCRGCSLGGLCLASSDCAEGECIAGSCQAPGCDNGARDGDETGVDCGGSCQRCRDGQPCLEAADCVSKVCGDGVCAAVSCADGVRNGDELDIDCGGSFCDDGCGIGTPCTKATDCQSGRCDETQHVCMLNCLPRTDECDGNLDEPCETNLLSSRENCGACGNLCDLPHATSSCTGGACQIDECVSPWLRCNTDNADGCEVNGSSDVTNCGGCGIVCPELHGTAKCVGSACVVECDRNFGDCDEDARTGCETSLDDVNNCGACGNECPDTAGVPNCLNGKCGVSDCDPGTGDCNDDKSCSFNLNDDAKNCGRCGNVCSVANGNARCDGGKCAVERCDDGYYNCDADAADGGYATGCETNVVSDAANCGGCGLRCGVVDHGSGTCQAGNCDLTCAAGYADCNGKVADGCETDITTVSDCGRCRNACMGTTPNCIESSGAYQCQARITLAGTAPYPQNTATAGSITFNATPRAGTNRLLLLALVSDSSTNGTSNGINGARPGSVTFGGQAMTAGPARAGVNDVWSPDLFVYYLALGDAAADGAQAQVVITGASGPASVELVQVLQLNGARQTNPITGSVGGVVGAPDPADPGVSTLSVPVATSGSLIYSFFADEYDSRACAVGATSGTCPSWSVSPSTNLTVQETMATAPFEFYPISTPNLSAHTWIRAFGMVVTAMSPALPGVGTYATTWSSPNPGRMTHLSVAVAPAQAP